MFSPRIRFVFLALGLLSSAAFSAPPSEVPSTLSHQGRIAADGVNFTGTGQFKFVLYHGMAPGTGKAIWKNDDPSPGNINEPAAAIASTVTKGLYSIALGESPQAPLPADIKPPGEEKLYLRIWFSDGVNGFQLLAPDRPLHAAAFARHASIAGEPISQLVNDANYLSTSGGGTITGNLNITGGLDVNGDVTFGLATTATGGNATAFGHEAAATGLNSMAWGFSTEATTTSTTAWGSNTTASGVRSTVWGFDSVSSGTQATAWGEGATASGATSTAWGKGTLAESFAETALGQYNTDIAPASTTAWNGNDRLLVIGKGTAAGSRADALVMKKSGDTELNGELCVNDDILVSGSYRYKTAKARKLQIQAFDFVNSQFTTLRATESGVINLSSSSSLHQYLAPVRLPAGATVTGMTLYLFEDSVDGTGRFQTVQSHLRKRTFPTISTNFVPVCTINQTNGSGLPHTLSSTTVTNGTVGTNDQLFLSVEMTTNNTLNIGIMGATVDYTTTTLSP